VHKQKDTWKDFSASLQDVEVFSVFHESAILDGQRGRTPCLRVAMTEWLTFWLRTIQKAH
jgi:hypothetical protein